MENEKIQFVKMGINGEGIGYRNRRPVFCPGVLPSETAEVEITESESTFDRARLKQILVPAASRIQPVCPYQKQCGGCPLMILPYEKQLQYKMQILQEALHKYARLDPHLIRNMHASEKPLHYRSQCKMPVQYSRGRITSGMFQPGTNYFVPVQECLIHETELEEKRKQVLDCISRSSLKAWNPKTGQGLRYLILRGLSGNYQCTLITGKDEIPAELTENLSHLEGMRSVCSSINSNRRSRELFGSRTRVLYGEDFIETEIGGIRLRLSSRSFFQMNVPQAEALYRTAISKIDPCDFLAEAYCGVGAMSLMAAQKARKTVGIESVPEAVKNAQMNAELNQLSDRVQFLCADAAEGLHMLNKDQPVNTLLADPPRSGMDPQMIAEILHSSIQKIIYVSCNPSTLAQNLARLQEQYLVRTVIPFDLFPQTPLIESVCVLERKKK